MLCIELVVPVLGPGAAAASLAEGDEEDFLTGALRMRMVRKPSRDRKRMVERSSSSWMLASPKMLGETSRTRSWLRTKVKARARL